ncbi:MAG: ASCH domain-containing protein [Bacteriovoracaceae bacterium]|nr:ASCH domain-containing protein [Bacteriovoracaceae bacterium]
MSNKTMLQKEFWERFCKSHEKYYHLHNHNFDAWGFGDTPEMANELGKLVLEGKKIATTSLFHSYKGHENELPQIGTFEMILDGSLEPLCIIFTHGLFVTTFDEVDSTHAKEEGEGDLTLEYWRKVHHEFFIKYKPDLEGEDLVVCEKFNLVFK